jgi:hypothetical protein
MSGVRKSLPALLGVFALLPAAALSQVMLEADGGTDAYGLIASKGFGLETPDCKHDVKHVSEILDADLGKSVFVFTLHRDLDDDRCINTDRQRVEMKTSTSSPDNMTAKSGETHTYEWKFKLDAAFQPSSSFCHIHQIKAQGGSDDDAPLITLTPRAGSPEQLQVIHVPSGGGGGEIAHTNLSAFKGTWVEAVERITYGESGTYQLTLTRVRDGAVLLTVSKSNLDLWRSGADIDRPKFGIYRSLDGKSSLRDESVRFSDFCVAEGNVKCGSFAGNNNGTLVMRNPDGRGVSQALSKGNNRKGAAFTAEGRAALEGSPRAVYYEGLKPF